jgi:tetratricopeptide (TPR) repeat protein
VGRSISTRNEITQTLNNLGNLYRSQGDIYRNQYNLGGAIDCYEKSIAIFRHLKDYRGLAKTLNTLANVYQSQYRWDKSIDCYEELLEIYPQIGDENQTANTLMNLEIVKKRYNNRRQTIRIKSRKVNYFLLLAILAMIVLMFVSIINSIWLMIVPLLFYILIALSAFLS